MYCQQQYPFQTEHPHQQHVSASVYGLPFSNYPASNYANAAPYSPPSDRPSPPSFRIEDILLQSKNGHFPTYATPYSSGFSSPSAGGFSHGYSYRVAHGMAHQHEGGVSMPVTMRSCVASNEKEFQGPSPAVLSSLPVYFRLKPTLRTASGRKCRKPRTVFTELQLMVLNREFNEHKYLSTPQRTKLAERLGLNQTQVKTWFQNRRMKWKKETTEGERKEDQFSPDIHSDSENENLNNDEDDSC